MKCSVCGRTFLDKIRLEQHSKDKHGAASGNKKKKNKPKSSKSVVGGPMGGTRERGVDLLASPSVAPGALPGSIVARIEVRPSTIGPRSRQIAQLWERWRPVSLELELVGSGNMMVSGSIVVGYSSDPSLRLLGDTSSVSVVAALKPSVQMRLTGSARFKIPCDTSRKWYLTDGTLDDSSHGIVAAVVLTTVGGFTGVSGVSMLCHWEIEYEGVAMAYGSGPGEELYFPDASWVGPFFTTSDSSYDSAVLTLKEHAGGSMVAFSSMVAGRLYKPGVGVSLRYNDGTSVEKSVQYASVLPPVLFATPGVVFFASKEDAGTWLRTHDASKCLQYKAQGSYATPTRIWFVQVGVSSVADPLENMRDVLADMSSRLEELALENSRLRAREQQQAGVTSGLVSDRTSAGFLQAVQKSTKAISGNLANRPRGVLSDPVKVFVVDPVPGENDFMHIAQQRIQGMLAEAGSYVCPVHEKEGACGCTDQK